MALFGGLTRRDDGRSVLQIYVDAPDAALLLELGGDRYHLFEGRDLDLDMSGGDPTDIAEVWFAIVPEDGSSRVIRPLQIRRLGGEMVLIAHCELRNDRRNFKLDRIVQLRRMVEDSPTQAEAVPA